MESLSQRDVQNLFAFLRSIYLPGGLQEFPKRVASALPKLISMDFAGYNEVNLRSQRNVVEVYPEEGVHFPGSQLIFEQHLHEHPLISHTARTHDDSVLKISDFLSDTDFERLGLYQEFFRVIGTKHQMAVALSARRSTIIGVALNRRSPDFSERERALLSLARPHLIQAYANASAWTRLTRERDVAHRALEELQSAVITLRVDGRVASLPLSAQRLLEKYFDSRPKSLGLPDLLRAWLTRFAAPRLQPPRPLHISRADHFLTVRAINEGDKIILLLHESIPPSAASLQVLGLTPREAEVLAWVARGRTNAEIADLLGMSARTVQKHLERVFQKLGVESRTAAASRAWEVLRQGQEVAS